MEETIKEFLKQCGELIELMVPLGVLAAAIVKIYDDSYQTKLTLSFMNHAEKVRYMRIQRIILMCAFAILFFIPGFVFNELKPAKSMLSGFIENCKIWVIVLIICAIPVFLTSLVFLAVLRKNSRSIGKSKKGERLYAFLVLTLVFFLMEDNIIMSYSLPLEQYVLVDVLLSIVAGLLCLNLFSEMYKHLTKERAYLKYGKKNNESYIFEKLGDYMVVGDKEWFDECGVFNLIDSEKLTNMELKAINLDDRKSNAVVDETVTQEKPVKAKEEKQKKKSRKRRIDMKTIITRICYVLNLMILVGVLFNALVLTKIKWDVPKLYYFIVGGILVLEFIWLLCNKYSENIKRKCKIIGEKLCKIGTVIGNFLAELWTKKIFFVVLFLLSMVVAEFIYSLTGRWIIAILTFPVVTFIVILVLWIVKKVQKNKNVVKKKEGK